MTNSQYASALLSELKKPERLSQCESSMVSLANWILDPSTNCLITETAYPTSRNHFVANVGSADLKIGSRALDGFKIVSITDPVSNTSKNVLYIEEWKAMTLVPTHIYETVYLKDYANCVINGGIKKARQLEVPLTNWKGRIKLALKRCPKIDEIVYTFVSDNICIQAQREIKNYNKYKKYIVQLSNQKKIPVKLEATTLYSYIAAIDEAYTINWHVVSDLKSNLKTFSSYENLGGKFYDVSIGAYSTIDAKYILPL